MTGHQAPPPPVPPLGRFDPLVHRVPAGTELVRVFSTARASPVEFNPGKGTPTRFAFFGDPVVPVLYAGLSADVALCETLLHDVPLEGGALAEDKIVRAARASIRPTRDLLLADFAGLGLRRLKLEPQHLTDTPTDDYEYTVKWAELAHDWPGERLDGCTWTSRKCNTDRALVLFGDRVGPGDLEVVPGGGMLLESGEGLNWVIDTCGKAGVEVLFSG